MFGGAKPPQNEETKFYPRSPYAVSKVFAHWITVNYREAYKIFACNGILFNHESPFRGETFVTKKIINGMCRIKEGMQKQLFLGNLYSKRDWGHSKDYVKAMWIMMQKRQAKDYVISTGNQYTIKQFINFTAKDLKMKISWKGSGLKEIGVWNNRPIILIDKNYFRPTEVESLLGDSKLARRELKWKPKYDINTLVSEMIVEEYKKIKK